MVNYYNNMRKDEASNGAILIGNATIDKTNNEADSTLTDISTVNAMQELRPNCPLRM